MISRRQALTSIAKVGALTLVAPSMFGCAFNVKDSLTTIISAISGILSYVGNTQPWAATLQAALAKLQATVATWTTGTPAAIVLDILDSIEAVLGAIPLTAIYSPLIDLIVTAIEAIVNYYAQNSPASVVKLMQKRLSAPRNPRIGRVALKTPHVLQSPQGAWKQQYNDAAVGIGLPQLKVA
jgi:hypothetical protein